MAKTETLHIRVNEQVKANAEETLDMLGISISEAVNTPYGHTHPAQPYSITIKCSEPLKLRHRAFSFLLVQFSDQRYYKSYN